MKLIAHPLGAPVAYPPQDRFWLPLRAFGHRVFPLVPCTEDPIDPPPFRTMGPEDGLSDDVIAGWDETEFNVGMVCGKPSNATVLEVKTQEAQDWLDEQDLPITPVSWSWRARHYFFNYLPHEFVKHPEVHGLKLFSDGDWIIYPGSMYEDGRLVRWELSPDDDLVADLPGLFTAEAASPLIH